MTTDVMPETRETIGEPTPPAEQVVEVRRRAGLAVLLGVGASLVAVAYLARAVAGDTGGGRGSVVDWALFVVLGLIGVANLAALLDARTPLLVADEHGVRLRLGRSWIGLPWGGLDLVEHQPRRGPLRDGVLVLRPRYVQRVLEDLDHAARRTARMNRRLHRAPLAVRLGVATRVLGDRPDLTAALQRLAEGRTLVVEPVPEAVAAPVAGPEPEPPPAPVLECETDQADEMSEPAAPVPTRTWPDPRPAVARLIGDLAGRLPRRAAPDDEVPEVVASQTPLPAREPSVAARAEVRRDHEAEVVGSERAHVEESRVSSIEPMLIDAYAPEPAEDPVVGPVFAAARQRLGLTVDQLAERTRIRAHVIESIEVDDFSACGGDFYARGHLRTLSRVLGVDVAPLLEAYDERYADAPIDPRRVFEADLAGAGSIRATRGGPNWSVLVAAVMALVLCWSIARLLTDGHASLPDRAVLSGSGGPNRVSGTAAKPVPVVLTAAGGGARVIVRDGTGRVVFSGTLPYGGKHTLQVSPPVRIQSTDGSVRVSVAGHDRGRMGPAGSPATSSYVVRR